MARANKKTAATAAQTEAATEKQSPVAQYDIKDLMDKYSTKSATIRFLDSEGLTRSQIVQVFQAGDVKMRYQHVRNVLITPLKRTEEAASA